ncbi:MAG TPA: AAA family ATPase [Anaeromyxobacter sp.]|nr:AAA family ATPase [Anaeromyxobacter sp.]
MRAHTKSAIPAPANAIDRDRLFSRLDQARSRPNVWLQGPPGSGKTTLLATYLKARRLSCLWLRLDPADADPATFLHEIAAAARRAAPKVRLPRFGPEYALGQDAFFRTFFRRLFDSLPPPFLLVFDDCHAVPAAAPLFALLQEGLAEVASGINAILLGRQGPPPALVVLQTKEALEVIGGEELRLSPAEVEAVARLRGTTDAGFTSALVRAVDGWAAGVVLLLAAAQGWDGSQSQLSAGPQTFEYFASEVFKQMDAGAQRVLLETALLPWIDVGVAEERLGIAGAGAVLAGLARDGYFTVVLAGPGPRYQYHSLFQSFLRGRAYEQLPSDRLASLRRAAAAAMAEAGDEASAVMFLRDAGAWPELANLLVRCGPGLLDAGRAGALAEWLAFLPPDVLAASPWLHYFRGLAKFGGDPAASQADLRAALDAFEASGEATGAYLAWAALVESFLFASMLEPLDSCLDQLDRLRATYPIPSSPDVAARVCASAMWALDLAPGPREVSSDEPRCSQTLEWLTRCEALGVSDSRARVMAGVAMVNYDVNYSGNLSHARVVLDEFAPQSTEIDPASAVIWHSVVALFQFFSGDATGSVETAAKALALSASTGARLWDFVLTAELAWGAAVDGRLDLADGALASLAARYDPSRPMEGVWFHRARCAISVARHDRRRAYEESRAARQCAERMHNDLFRATDMAAEATSASLGGAPPGEGPSLETALALARQRGSRLVEHVALMGLAARERSQGGPSLEARLQDAFAQSRETGYREACFLTREELADLCAAALEKGIEPECVRAYVTANRLAPPAWARDLAAWPWALSVRVLGDYEIRVGDLRLAASAEGGRVPDLLALLVAHGGEVTASTLLEALWPNADGDRAHHSLETTLYRLRKLLGPHVAITQREGVVTFDTATCWTDLRAIRRRMARVAALCERDTVDGATLLREAEQLVELYRGPFLPHVVTAWAEALRQSLRGALARHLRSAGAALDRLGLGSHAQRILEQVLGADPDLPIVARPSAGR